MQLALILWKPKSLMFVNAAQRELPIIFAIDMSLARCGDQNILSVKTPWRLLRLLSTKTVKSGKSSNMSAR